MFLSHLYMRTNTYILLGCITVQSNYILQLCGGNFQNKAKQISCHQVLMSILCRRVNGRPFQSTGQSRISDPQVPGALRWSWHRLLKHSDIGLLYRQRAAVSQLTLVLGSRSGGSGIKRPYPSHPEHYGKPRLSDGIVQSEQGLWLVSAVVSRVFFKDRAVLFWPVSLSPSVQSPD